MKQFFYSLFIGLFVFQSSFAQDGNWCGYQNPQEYLAGDASESDKAILRKKLAEFDNVRKLKRADDTTRIVIPVVFHILHTYGPENISDLQVMSQIEKMNKDFNALNEELTNLDPAFDSIVGNFNIEFRLAAYDPDGNCTNGINRYYDERTGFTSSAAINAVKPEYFWPRDEYLNCLIVKSIQSSGGGTTLGFAQFPFSGDSLTDGIVMVSESIGTIGTGSQRYASVTTHEVGHWLGLYHTWGNCAAAGSQAACDCDDEVDDTPLTTGNASVCPIGKVNCGTRDNVQNYMDYSFCFVNFTLGQQERVRDVLFNVEHRRNLWSEANLIKTGVFEEPEELCYADFTAQTERRVICQGEAISFQDASYHGIKNRKWSFEGGTPATASTEDPTVAYNMSGKFTVNLNITAGSGETRTIRKPEYITVLASPLKNPAYVEGFENYNANSIAALQITTLNGDNVGMVTDAAGYSSKTSLLLKNDADKNGLNTEVIIRPFDFSESENLSFNFRYAHGSVAGTNDKLLVQASTDCGAKWVTRKTLQASSINTAPDGSGNFVPADDSEWKQSTVSIASYKNENVIFRFLFESGGGGNLYIDDIEIFGTTDLTELPAQKQISVVNPVNREAKKIVLNSMLTTNVQVNLIDLTGKSIFVKKSQLVQGENSIGYNQDIPAGTYILTTTFDSGDVVHTKLVIR